MGPLVFLDGDNVITCSSLSSSSRNDSRLLEFIFVWQVVCLLPRGSVYDWPKQTIEDESTIASRSQAKAKYRVNIPSRSFRVRSLHEENEPRNLEQAEWPNQLLPA
jgi:hypothetical protein